MSSVLGIHMAVNVITPNTVQLRSYITLTIYLHSQKKLREKSTILLSRIYDMDRCSIFESDDFHQKTRPMHVFVTQLA